MERRGFGLKLLLGAMLLFLWPLFPGQTVPAAEAGGEVYLDPWVQTTQTDFATGAFTGTVATSVGDGEVRLAAGQESGVYASAAHVLPFPCLAAGLLYRGQVPAGTTLSFDLRTQDEAGDWTSWTPVPMGPWTDPAGRLASETLVVFPLVGHWLQYRVTFTGGEPELALEEVEAVCLGAAGSPTVAAVPPWKEANGWPKPVPAEEWEVEPVTPSAVLSATIGPLRIEVRPATQGTGGQVETPALLRMLQRFQREVLGFNGLAYTFLLDPQGAVYQGREGPLGDILYIGILGADPREAISPTVEDALVALLDWWRASQSAGGMQFTLATPSDPLLAGRLQSRLEAGNLRRNEWYLARGATGADIDEWILLANPSSRRIRVTAELHREDGRLVRRTLRVPAEARASLFVDSLISKGPVWSRVQADGDVLVERALYYGHDADDSTGLESLSREWYLPGGSQDTGFTTTLTLLNPGSDAVTATVTVFAPTGPAAEAKIMLAPATRLDLPIRQVYTGTAPVGCRVLATAPIAVEQEVRSASSQAGYGMPGTPLLSRRWTFAGVETASPYVTVLALLNPYSETVTFTLTLMSEDGTTLRRPYTMQPGEQVLNLNSILPELALAAEVQAGQPIAAARVTFFAQLSAAHATLGAVRPARHWYLAEGSTAEPFETFLLLANPNPVATELKLTFLSEQGEIGQTALSMPAYARLTVSLNQVMPDVSGLSSVVESEWPVVVERSMYMHGGQGGHSCLGIAR